MTAAGCRLDFDRALPICGVPATLVHSSAAASSPMAATLNPIQPPLWNLLADWRGGRQNAKSSRWLLRCRNKYRIFI
jgi:hypothetical protein